jgi:hypothetical protein
MKTIPRIVEILDVTNYRIMCLFDNRQIREVDFENYIHNNLQHKFIAPLSNHAYFMNVIIDEVGGLCWPNGYDCSASKIYDWDKEEIPA